MEAGTTSRMAEKSAITRRRNKQKSGAVKKLRKITQSTKFIIKTVKYRSPTAMATILTRLKARKNIDA
jgi:hypothetical protein